MVQQLNHWTFSLEILKSFNRSNHWFLSSWTKLSHIDTYLGIIANSVDPIQIDTVFTIA